jgi:hypothetical protein
MSHYHSAFLSITATMVRITGIVEALRCNAILKIRPFPVRASIVVINRRASKCAMLSSRGPNSVLIEYDGVSTLASDLASSSFDAAICWKGARQQPNKEAK